MQNNAFFAPNFLQKDVSIAYLKRHIDATFLAWKERTDRKPLMLRGARQVGKSSAVKHFGKTFENFVEVNFDENKTVH